MSDTQKFTIIGIEPSKGSFKDEKTNRDIAYDSTNFRVLVPNKNGIGMKEAVHKMAGSDNYGKFKDLTLPCDADFEFELEFNGKFPKTKLVAVEVI
jgi:hypothetical protein